LAEYRKEDFWLKFTANFNILKVTDNRIIDGTIINTAFRISDKEFENDLVKNVMQLEEITFGLINKISGFRI
jgi:hypothetical protein